MLAWLSLINPACFAPLLNSWLILLEDEEGISVIDLLFCIPKTAARGPENEGCGCGFTPKGCCPDNHTPAGEGGECPCHTFEHGCCPDGETVADGPSLEGCSGCEDSAHGCCPDGATPAEGEYNLGRVSPLHRISCSCFQGANYMRAP